MVPVYPDEAPSAQVYYSNPPFYPGYQWQYWYTVPSYPGFVFFFGNDGRGKYRHYYHQPRGKHQWGGRNEYRGRQPRRR